MSSGAFNSSEHSYRKHPKFPLISRSPSPLDELMNDYPPGHPPKPT